MARIVLVHGAFADAWVWEPVVPRLEAAGHTVETFDLPGITLDEYAERTCEVLRSSDEPAVLVGHSMGGVVITQAAARCPERVAKLIYVAAFLPRDGQSLDALTKLPEGLDDQVKANLVVDGDPPVGTIPAEKAHAILHAEASEDESAAWIAHLKPQPLEPFMALVDLRGADLDSMPREYIVCTRDRAIPPALQRRMSTETPCGEVVEIPADHMPQLSALDELVEALDRLAR
jgi:pimeloyl-ACP methyl ester carboxylesterase